MTIEQQNPLENLTLAEKFVSECKARELKVPERVDSSWTIGDCEACLIGLNSGSEQIVNEIRRKVESAEVDWSLIMSC